MSLTIFMFAYKLRILFCKEYNPRMIYEEDYSTQMHLVLQDNCPP